MSGFVGIINFDGRPVETSTIERMTHALAFRGPDAQQTWVCENVGLGAALLRTTNESSSEVQPFTLDSQAWIVGDVRVDGRDDLTEKLRSTATADLHSASDIELVLHAYRQWGESCVEHLIGDFSFAIWDKARRMLFCARDHIGVKSFFYARLKSGFVFSNTLNAVRLHPEISDELNEVSVGDFLLFGMHQDVTATIFRDVLRLAPAHTLSVLQNTVSIRRYWTLPRRDELRYKDPQQYVDHFRQLLRTAVADRLRTDKVSVLMSGGLDSTSIAATARDLLRERRNGSGLQGFSVTWNDFFPDPEEKFAGIAARHLGIPLEYMRPHARLFSAWCDPSFRTPEPTDDPLLGNTQNYNRQLIGHSRVALTGFDGDTAFECNLAAHFRSQLRLGHIDRALQDAICYAMQERSIPPVGFRTFLKRRRERNTLFASYPQWLNPEFERRCKLRDRWVECNSSMPLENPIRTGISRIFSHPIWPALMDSFDAAYNNTALEFRHPFIDLRLVVFLLGVPPIPWCLRKSLIRKAMERTLPEAILARPKTPLAGDPLLSLLKHDGLRELPQLPQGSEYVRFDAIFPRLSLLGDPNTAWNNLRPFALSLWLSSYGIREARVEQCRGGN